MTDPNNIEPLTTDQLRVKACNWNLAGDAGLLAHLQKFSGEILSKAEAAEKSVSDLSDKVEEATTNFSNVSNQFLSLQNSQFMENRVYEEDTPTEERKPTLPIEEETQQQTLTRYKNAVAAGINLLHTHYEEIEVVQSSDSEEDAAGSSRVSVWRPKPVYSNPLPLLIGSAEWWADDNVGLGEFSENKDSDSELLESDSDAEVPQSSVHRVQRTPSSSSSSLETESKTSSSAQRVPNAFPQHEMERPAEAVKAPVRPDDHVLGYERDMFGAGGNNLFDDPPTLFDDPPPLNTTSVKPEDSDSLFGDEEEEKEEEVAPKPVMRLPTAFTRELSARLGNAPQSHLKEKEENVAANKLPFSNVPKEQKQKLPSSSQDNLFAKEPTGERPFATEPTKKPLNPLFDDDVKKEPSKNLFDDIKPVENRSSIVETKKSSNSLFDDDDDDSLFRAARRSNVANVRATGPAALGLFDDNESEDLFGGFKPKPVENKIDSARKSTIPPPKPKSTNLFEDDLFSDDVESDLFAPTKPSNSKLPDKIAFPRLQAVEEKVSPLPSGMSSMKSSTPMTVGDALFGEISNIYRTNSPAARTPDLSVSGRDEYNEAFRESHGEEYTDPSSSGCEPSNAASSNIDSTPTWFDPLVSSTRAYDSSGYKTKTAALSAGGASIIPPNRQENSSPALARVEQSTNPLAQEDNDDLFSSKPKPKVRVLPPIEDLFSSETKSTIKPVVNNKSSVSSKSKSLFDDDDDDEDDKVLFGESKKIIDNTSGSSSRSSLFDELNPAKSALSSIFSGRGKESKALFDDLDDDEDLFSNNSKPETKKESLAPKAVSQPLAKKKPGEHSKPTKSWDPDSDDLFKSAETKPEVPVKSSDELFTSTGKESSKINNVLKEPLFERKENLVKNAEEDLFTTNPITDELKSKPIENNGKSLKEKAGNIIKIKNSNNDEAIENGLFKTVNVNNLKETPKIEKIPETKNLLNQKTADIPGKRQSNDNLFISKNEKKDVFAALEDDDDLFSSTGSPKNNTDDLFIPAKSSNQSKNIGDGKAGFVSTKEAEESKNETKTKMETKPKPPDSLNLPAPLTKDTDQLDGEILPKKIGKLNIPININPAALLPGAKPRKKSPIATSNENDILKTTKDEEVIKDAPNNKIGKLNVDLKINPMALLPGAKISKPSLNNKDDSEETVPSEIQSQKEETVSPQLLTSVQRERVRGPVKRRPQSRRARQEALRVSGIDFGNVADENDLPTTTSDSVPSPAITSNPLSPSTDEDDCFQVPALEQDQDDQLFKNSSIGGNKDENLLFVNAPVISPTENFKSPEVFVTPQETLSTSSTPSSTLIPGKLKSTIGFVKPPLDDHNDLFYTPKETFSESESSVSMSNSGKGDSLESRFTNSNIPTHDSDDELFSSASSLKTEVKPFGSVYDDEPPPLGKNPFSKSAGRTSLFDDDDDDIDDIFSSSASVPPVISEEPLKTPKTASVPNINHSKVEKEPFIDPLGYLQ